MSVIEITTGKKFKNLIGLPNQNKRKLFPFWLFDFLERIIKKNYKRCSIGRIIHFFPPALILDLIAFLKKLKSSAIY
jgi:hypothetical protein